MSGSLDHIEHVNAGADLRAHQWKVVELDGTLGVSNGTSLGILQNKVESGADASVLVAGRSKFAAGGAITAGKALKVASGGWCVAAVSGDTVIGRSLVVVASGMVGAYGVFDFISYGYLPTSMSG